jgi:hypothetical protein
MKNLLRQARDMAYSANVVRKGLCEFRKSGVTPPGVYGQMISLYCKSRGYSREILAAIIRLQGQRYRFDRISGALGKLTASDCEGIAKHIKRDGYYTFPQRLDPVICARLKQFALNEPLTPNPAIDDVAISPYPRMNPRAVTYALSEQQMVNNKDIQTLMCDSTFLCVAQAYLKTFPVFDLMAMWWTTTYKKEAHSGSAQLYHFDMDHNKWIKIFIYLTDVTPETGPHCYIETTHKAGAKPAELLKRGYVRIPDKDLRRYYDDSKFKEVCGPVGTIIAGDTAAFHKGKPATGGDRLVLEFEYGNSLFGVNHETLTAESCCSELQSAMSSHPHSFTRLKR